MEKIVQLQYVAAGSMVFFINEILQHKNNMWQKRMKHLEDTNTCLHSFFIANLKLDL